MTCYLNRIEKDFTFEAAHVLKHHRGKCAQLHGHSYKMTIVLDRDHLDKTGSSKNMIMDFGDISANVKPLLDNYLDHHYLNDTLKTDSPTAEFIAQYIFGYLQPALPYLIAVKLGETCTGRAVYMKLGGDQNGMPEPFENIDHAFDVVDKLPE